MCSSEKIQRIKQELKKSNLPRQREIDLIALLNDYQGAIESQLLTHTARLTTNKAQYTTQVVLGELNNIYEKLFPNK